MFLKRTSFLSLLFPLFILCSASSFAEKSAEQSASHPVIVLRGSIEETQYPELELTIGKIWDFIIKKTNLLSFHQDFSAPMIYFSPFIFSKEEPHWLQEQRNWIKNHPEIWDDYLKAHPDNQSPAEPGNPFPVQFAGFQYYETNLIQVNPEIVFLPYIQNSPQGIPQDLVRFGYYSVGHELYHYALNLIGVPVKLHHCIFVSERNLTQQDFSSELADYLIEENISSFFVKKRGSQTERILDPCSYLNETEKNEAAQWLLRF